MSNELNTKTQETAGNIPLLIVKDLCVDFVMPNQQLVRPVENVSLSVNPGEIVCLVGESGCGKSVTVRSIFGLTPKPGRVSAKSILFDGRDVSKLSNEQLRSLCRKEVGYVFQDPMTYLNPLMTVGEQVAESMGRTPKVVEGGKRMQKIAKLFSDLSIPDPKRVIFSYPHQLSGGMRQRVMVAIALARNPRLLILDEPTTALDVTVQAQIVDLIKSIKRTRDVSVLFVTHDFGLVAELADQVYVMYSGRIVEHGPVKKVFATPQHPYTRGLIECVTSLFEMDRNMSYIGGEVPDPKNPPKGCRFHLRCPSSTEKCRIEMPPLVEKEGQFVRCHLAGENSQSPTTAVIIKPRSPEAEEASKQGLLYIDQAVQHYPVHGGTFSDTSSVVHAVNGVSLEIGKSQILSLVGESGSGKSTLGRMVAGMENPKEGKVDLAGAPASQWTKDRNLRPLAQMVFQDPYSSLNPRKTIQHALTQPLINFGLVSREKAALRAAELLAIVGLTPAEEYLGRYPHELSGGQRQRVVLARALAAQPQLLIADEPVSSLDISTRAQILGLIKSFQLEQNLSVLLITHDLAVVRSIADKVSVMYLGNLVETGDAREVINNPMHPYSKALVSAIPLPDPNRVRVDSSTMLKDEPPSPIHLPSGCPFHPRCPAATEKCSQNKPVWKQLSPNHAVMCHLYD